MISLLSRFISRLAEKLPIFLIVTLLFSFQSISARGLDSSDFTSESHPGTDPIRKNLDFGLVEFIQGDSWISFTDFDFGEYTNQLTISAAAPPGAGGKIEVRLDSEIGQLIGTLDITPTGSFGSYQEFGITFPTWRSGKKDLYLLFIDSENTGTYLFNTGRITIDRRYPDSNTIDSAVFTSESNPGELPIQPNFTAGTVEFIQGNSWIAYSNFDFGQNSNHLCIEAAAPTKGGQIQARIGSPTGALLGSVNIDHTGSYSRFLKFDCIFPESISGFKSLYLNFVDTKGQGGNLFNIRNITADRIAPASLQDYSDGKDQDLLSPLTEYAFGLHPETNDSIPLGISPAESATTPTSISVSLRTDSSLQAELLVSSDLSTWDEITLSYDGGIWQTSSNAASIKDVSPLADGLFQISLEDTQSSERLFVRLGIDTIQGDLNVYPPVNGLSASTYYKFEVQKLSELNAPNLADVTNWETPFAWFTKCKDYTGGPTDETAYYSDFIGSWTHTYCNFEIAEHTPFVVKVTRLNEPGAPSGPITLAAAHPKHRVDSCEIIDGAVYVTMSQPGLIAVDIDGQLDGRDTPRAIALGFDAQTFPHRNKMDGVHAVTIFANPIIADKPDLTDTANVRAVEPGAPLPTDDNWTTLYFKPGVHRLSLDADGNERQWKITDPLRLQNGKNYYIPGDAIVYGNFHDYSDNERSKNIRVFGHGTLSGEQMDHPHDLTPPKTESDPEVVLQRMLFLSRAENCVYEGITIADQAHHGVYIEGEDRVGIPNYIRWVKSITWRVNNDGMGVRGNGWIDDCFIRHQDDGIYLRGLGCRRTVFWSDVNGAPLRCSFITTDRDENYPDRLPQELLIEDIDIIYARGVFGNDTSRSFAIFSSDGGSTGATYADGTRNTAQHLVLRNIRITDPRPVRPLFGFEASTAFATKLGDWAGLRFENINYENPQTFGWANHLIGSADAGIKFWIFDNVTIGGEQVDTDFLNDPDEFVTDFFSDPIIR